MHRLSALALLTLFLGSAGAAVWLVGKKAPVEPSTSVAAASASSPPAPPALADAGDAAPPSTASEAPATAPDLTRLADGGVVPQLPKDAPKSVSFGVILFRYQGAELAPKDAPSKAEALKRAQAALEEARTDFSAAAKKGDRGSTADAGRVPRGILEPAVEYALFTLGRGALYPEPLDTPRGYWVLRRNQ